MRSRWLGWSLRDGPSGRFPSRSRASHRSPRAGGGGDGAAARRRLWGPPLWAGAALPARAPLGGCLKGLPRQDPQVAEWKSLDQHRRQVGGALVLWWRKPNQDTTPGYCLSNSPPFCHPSGPQGPMARMVCLISECPLTQTIIAMVP